MFSQPPRLPTLSLVRSRHLTIPVSLLSVILDITLYKERSWACRDPIHALTFSSKALQDPPIQLFSIGGPLVFFTKTIVSFNHARLVGSVNWRGIMWIGSSAVLPSTTKWNHNFEV